MRATVMRNKKLVVDDIATPEPGAGEALVKTLLAASAGRISMRSNMRTGWSRAPSDRAARS